MLVLIKACPHPRQLAGMGATKMLNEKVDSKTDFLIFIS